MNWLAFVSAFLAFLRSLAELASRRSSATRLENAARRDAKARAHDRLVKAIRARQQIRYDANRAGQPSPHSDPGNGDIAGVELADGRLLNDKYRRD